MYQNDHFRWQTKHFITSFFVPIIFFYSNWVDFNIFCRYNIVLRYREIVWKISFTVLRYGFHILKHIFLFSHKWEPNAKDKRHLQIYNSLGILQYIIVYFRSTQEVNTILTMFRVFFRGNCLCVSRVYKDQIVIDKYSQCGERMVQSLLIKKHIRSQHY